MSTGYNDLIEGERHELLVRVKSAERVPRHKRAFELTVANRHGIEFPFVV